MSWFKHKTRKLLKTIKKNNFKTLGVRIDFLNKIQKMVTLRERLIIQLPEYVNFKNYIFLVQSKRDMPFSQQFHSEKLLTETPAYMHKNNVQRHCL